MKPVLWFVAALLVAGSIVFFASLATRRRLPPVALQEGESLPQTAAQRGAALALAGVLLLAMLAGGCVAFFGPQEWWDNDAVRLPVTFLLLGALGIYLAFMIRIRALARQGEGYFDERDAAIVSRSCAGVGGAMMGVLAVWMIALTESHIKTHLIPSYFLYLIFWSCVMTNVIASLAGILLAYRRA